MTLVATLAAPVPIVTEDNIETYTLESVPKPDDTSAEHQPHQRHKFGLDVIAVIDTCAPVDSEQASASAYGSGKKQSLTSEQVMWAIVNCYRQRLSAVEETDLARRAKTNPKDRDLLLRRMMWLPVFRANGLAIGAKRSHFTDMVQEGAIGLLKALERYEPDSGARFSTYAKSYVTGRIYAYLRGSISLAPITESERAARRAKKNADADVSGIPSIIDITQVPGPEVPDSEEQDEDSDSHSTRWHGFIDSDVSTAVNHVWYMSDEHLDSIPSPESCRCHSALGALLHSIIQRYLVPQDRAAFECLISRQEPLDSIAQELGVRVDELPMKKHRILKKLSSYAVRAKVTQALNVLGVLSGCGSLGCIWPINRKI